MWTNLTGVVGAAIQKVREIESQLDNAVGVEKMAESDSANPDSLAASTINPTPFADDPQSVIREETNKKMKTKKKITTTSSSSISSMVSEVAPSNEQVQNPPIAIPRELDSQVESPHKSTTAAVPHTSIGEAKQMEELRTQMDLLRELHKQEISKLINKHESAIQTMQTQHKTEMQNCSQLQTDLREQLKGLQSDKMELHIQLQSCMENTIKKTEIDRSVTRDDTSVGTESNNRIEELQRQLQEQVQLVFRREQDVLKLEMQVQEQMQLVNEHSHSCEDARSQLTNALHALQVRESSLESLQSQLATALTDQQHIKTLFDEVAVEKQQLELALQSNNNIHNGGSNHLQQLQEQLEAYQVEGQKLAKKQSEMEKSVRQSKQQLREKELEITKLKESREQLVKVLEQTQDALKRQESEGDKAQKALQAMQAVSAASSERLVRLEQDLQISHEEQLTTRKALEHAWSELSEAKRAQQEQRGECDDLRKQLGEGASRAINTESMRREVEQREAVLRATSQQLQDQLQRSMRDAAAREDRLSEELGELRRRWQEAVSSREQLASEIASASAPLLRQIAALQEQLRVKTEQWTQVESALVERAMKSESAAEQFEHRRSLLEEQSQNFHHSLTETQARLANSQKQLVETQAANQQLQRSEARHIEDARDLQARLAQETAQVSSLQVALRDLELRHRLAITETNEAHRDNERKLSAQCDDMQKEIATLRDTLSRYKMSATNATPTASSSAPLFFTNQSSSSSFSGNVWSFLVVRVVGIYSLLFFCVYYNFVLLPFQTL